MSSKLSSTCQLRAESSKSSAAVASAGSVCAVNSTISRVRRPLPEKRRRAIRTERAYGSSSCFSSLSGQFRGRSAFFRCKRRSSLPHFLPDAGRHWLPKLGCLSKQGARNLRHSPKSSLPKGDFFGVQDAHRLFLEHHHGQSIHPLRFLVHAPPPPAHFPATPAQALKEFVTLPQPDQRT